MDKRGRENVMLGAVLFVVLNAAFIGLLWYGMMGRIDSARVVEESYAKQIALFMNAASPGTLIELNIEPLLIRADENAVNLAVVVDCDAHVIIIRSSRTGAYRYPFFNTLSSCTSTIDQSERLLRIEVGDE